jgi:LmbE family N-acetylglucosaminyl deacetylase
MRHIALRPASGRRRLSVLCLGAHSDDIEIGCGGTMLTLLAAHPGTRVHWVVFSAPGRRGDEARRSASRFLRAAGAADVQLHEFRDGFFPHEGAAIKEVFEALKPVAPDVVFTHHGGDRHQDHRVVCELTWNTFRDHLILEYEIPKYDGDLTSPNVFVPLALRHRRRKVALLLDSFPSQRRKRWFTAATFEALMRLRGIESAVAEGYAEGFHARKLALNV